MQAISGNDKAELDDSIDKYVAEIINAKVQINLMDGTIQFPKMIETYKYDFGTDKQTVIEFIYRYLDNPDIDMN